MRLTSSSPIAHHSSFFRHRPDTPGQRRSSSLIVLLALLSFLPVTTQGQTVNKAPTIVATGGSLAKPFIAYIAKMTGKERPRICYVPTASADNPYGIIRWYERCRDLPVEPYVLRVWISSYSTKTSFADLLLSMDAIVVGGGNTLNMMAIWHAQGIDTVLAEAYRRGIILAGGSAGSLCWFEEGTTDSRPGHLTTVHGLGLLPYSHSPHYHSEGPRRPLYMEKVASGEYKPGYAMDDGAAIIFRNGKADKAIALSDKYKAWFVTVKDGKAVEEPVETEVIVNDKEIKR